MKKDNKMKIIGIVIQLIGLVLIGINIGKNYKTGETDLTLVIIGLVLVMGGLFLIIIKKKENNKRP